jgi:2-C-methyl-D-erythritol 2,4-cyclodiphosphate synthase
MQQTMAEVIGCSPDQISIKATTTERLGFTGREEGISAYAVALIERSE